ncbi:MAG: PAS domain S-box protein [Ignavibacteriales bacterium]
MAEKVPEPLFKHETQFRAAIDGLPDAFAILTAVRDNRGKIIDFVLRYANNAAARTARMNLADMTGRSLIELFPGFGQTNIFKTYVSVAESGETKVMDSGPFEMKIGEGKIQGIFELRITKLDDGLTVTWRDITENKKREYELAFQAHILANVSDAIFDVDDELNILSWNRGAETLYGFRAEEVIGKNLQSVLRVENTPEELEAMMQELRQNGTFSTQVTQHNSRGETIEVESATIQLTDTNGRVIGYTSVNRDITARVRAEEILRRNEEIFRLTFDHAPVGIEHILPDGKWLRFNKKFAEILGYEPEDLMQYTYRDVTYPDDLPAEEEQKKLLLERKSGSFSMEKRYFHKNGSIVYAILNCSVMQGSRDGSEYLVAVVNDITGLKRAEESIRRQKERAENLLVISHQATDSLSDYESVLDLIVKSTAEQLGDMCIIRLISGDGKRLQTAALYHPDEKQAEYIRRENEASPPGVNEGIHGRVMRTGKPVLYYINKDEQDDGTAEYPAYIRKYNAHSIMIAPLRTQGETIGTVSVMRYINKELYTEEDLIYLLSIADNLALTIQNSRLYDSMQKEISERRQIEISLLEQQGLLNTLVDNMPVGVWIFNEKGDILSGNKEVYAIWGGVKLVGLENFQEYKGWWSDTGRKLEPEEWAAARAIAKGERVLNQMIDILTFDGQNKTILNSAVPILDHKGKITGAVAVNQDITESRKRETELRETLNELERSNHELEQFAYVASHDLQEPLRMVASYTQLLAKRYQGNLDEKANEYIGFAIDGARRMQMLIRDVLQYSKVSGNLNKKEKVDIDQIIKDALSELHLEIMNTRAQVKISPMPSITADPAQVKQLFLNLISNSLKFQAKDQIPEIDINSVKKGSEWVFSVRDNGIGIDPEHNERIFMLFQRLHDRYMYPGTGLGLAICKKIVERHGGRIWLESEPEKGSVFYFTLPA